MAEQDVENKNMTTIESSNDTALLDQLQQEFDTLVSTEEPTASPGQSGADDKLDRELEQELEHTLLGQEAEHALLDQETESALIDQEITDALTDQEPEASSDNNFENSNETLQSPTDSPAVELDAANPFEEDVPAHADLSGPDNQQGERSSRFIVLASIIVLVVVGGSYWLATSSDDQPENKAVVQSDPGPEPGSNKTTDASPDAAADSAIAMQSPAHQPTAGATTQPETATPKTAMTTQQGIRHNPKKSVTKAQTKTRKADIQRAAVEKAKAKQLAAKRRPEKIPHSAARPSATSQVTVIEPVTPLQDNTTTEKVSNASNQTGNWVIDLASVNSDKSARQHVARMRAMGVQSTVVQINDKGRIYHHIRVGGFSSKQEAIKRRDALVKLLGLRDATVESL